MRLIDANDLIQVIVNTPTNALGIAKPQYNQSEVLTAIQDRTNEILKLVQNQPTVEHIEVLKYNKMLDYEEIKALKKAWDSYTVGDALVLPDYAELEIKTIANQQQWIPCNERLPKHGQQVLVTWSNIIYIAYYQTAFWDMEEFYIDDTDDFQVTAWMPLPEPYKED